MNEKELWVLHFFGYSFVAKFNHLITKNKPNFFLKKLGEKDTLGMRLLQKVFVVGLAYQGNDIVFRFIIEYYSSLHDIVFRFIIEYYSSLHDIVFRFIIEHIIAYMILCLDSL